MKLIYTVVLLSLLVSARANAQVRESIFDDVVFGDLKTQAAAGQEMFLDPPAAPRGVPDAAQIEGAKKTLDQLVPRPAAGQAAQERAYFDALAARIPKAADEPALLYVLLETRRAVALRNRWVVDTLQCCGELRRHFQVSEAPMYREVAMTLAPTERQDVNALFTVLHNALQRLTVVESSADPKDVTALLSTVLSMTAKLPDPSTKLKETVRANLAQARVTAWTSAHAAWVTVRDGGGTPKEKGAVGSFLCLYQEAWDAGLKYLADSDDAASRVAKRDLTTEFTAANGQKMGDAWWEASSVAVPARQPAMRRRAARWYEIAKPALSRADRAAVQQRITDATAAPEEVNDPEAPVPHGPSVVLVLDGTGTMVGLKFQLVALEVARFLDAAPESMRVGIVLFKDADNRGVEAVDRKRLISNSPENRKRISEFLSKFSPVGSTNPMPAMELAFGMKPSHLVLLTDGEFDNLVTYNEVLQSISFLNPGKRVHVHTIMFGDNDARAQKVLRDIAEQNGGQMKFVPLDALMK